MSFFTDLLMEMDPIGIAIICIIIAIFVFSFVVNLTVRKRYIAILDDLEKSCSNKAEKFKTSLLNNIVESYKSAAKGNYNEVNTQAIIENCFNTRLRILLVCEKFVKHTVSLLISLGLLGTFLGLSLAVSELVEVFNTIMQSDAVSDPTFSSSFINDLIPSVYGMGVAFTTSLFGLGCSIVFSLVTIIFSAEEARENLMVRIEEYLDNTVALVIAKDKETEYTIMNKILRDTFVEFGEKIESALKQTVDTFGEKLTGVAMEVNITSKALDNTVEKFDQSLKNFSENIKDFTEFNNNLKNNIEKMDVSFIKVTEALSDTSKIIVENYNAIENFSKDIKGAAEEITSYNRQVVQDVGNIVEEVKTTVSSIKELGEAIKSDLSTRTGEIKDYQEKFSALAAKLSEEVNKLGEKTAEAFSKTLDESSQTVSNKLAQSVEEVLKEVFDIMDDFKENEKILAKTIMALPDQVIAYNETAAAQVEKQLDEVKRLFKK
ncbi:MAG TPA: methyl-accepting chemotaxis protein [Acetivibrio sp.]|nr:methyl-accepting chemotaxis protein [Acetivibrio sp.]HPT89924.1 methyl-accepting chemotaxis protein [Acetivibrio sp.]HQA57986.1 methyl-accepting chemotaxis protein [Acetivibrio sp.]